MAPARVARTAAPAKDAAAAGAKAPANAASSVAGVFEEVQNSHSNLQHLLKQFWKLERKVGAEQFAKELKECVNLVLIVQKREPAVERIVQFVALALTSYDQELSIAGMHKVLCMVR